MNIAKPSVSALVMLSALLGACTSVQDKKLPSVEEILKRPQVEKTQTAVVPTGDGRKGGVLSVLSVVNEKGGVEGAVCRDGNAAKALCREALAQARPKQYKPKSVCSGAVSADGAKAQACENVPSYAEHIYLLYGKNDNYKGGAYRMRDMYYPRRSLESEEEGRVVLSVVVSPEGRVDSVLTDKSSGYRGLDDAARIMVKESVFLPRVIDGKPVWVQFGVPVVFRLDYSEPQRPSENK